MTAHDEKTAAEVVARLNPDSNLPDGMTRGGLPQFTEHDIAMALGDPKIPDGARYLARIKYGGHERFYRDLAVSLYMNIMDRHGEEWISTKTHRKGLILDLAKLAVFDYCLIPICPACHGVSERMIGAKRVVCPDCGGTRVSRITQEQRAEMLDLPLFAWERIWSHRFGEMHAVLRNWDWLAVNALVQRLFTGDSDNGVSG